MSDRCASRRAKRLRLRCCGRSPGADCRIAGVAVLANGSYAAKDDCDWPCAPRHGRGRVWGPILLRNARQTGVKALTMICIRAAREVLRLPREIHSLKELKDDRHIHESSSYRDRFGVGIADSRKSNVSSKGATNSLRGLHPSLRCDDRKSGGVTARRNFNAGATSHDRNRTNDKRHKVYNRRDARQPLTALTALGSQTIGSQSAPSRLVEVGEPFSCAATLHSARIPSWQAGP
jgi:hypothetical protein